MAKEPKDTPETREAKAGVVPDPADPAFADWFEKLFDAGFPEKIELVQLTGYRGNRRGMCVDTRAVKPNEQKWTRELCVNFSNKWLEAAQRNCNGVNAPVRYGALAFGNTVSPAPYSTYVFSLKPNHGIGVDSDQTSDGAEDGDHEGALDPNRMMLERFKQWSVDDQWRVQQNHMTMGQMLKMYSDTVVKQQEHIDRLMDKTIKLTEGMINLRLKEIEASWDALKVKAAADGLDMVKGIVMGKMLKGKEGEQKQQQEGAEPPKKSAVAEAVSRFIQGITDEQKVKLFGEWQQDKLLKPGLFTEAQCRLVVAMAEDSAGPNAPQELRQSLTMEQLTTAQSIFSMEQLMPLLQVFNEQQQPQPQAEQAH